MKRKMITIGWALVLAAGLLAGFELFRSPIVQPVQPQQAPSQVTIVFNGIPLSLVSNERLPEKLLARAGIPFSPDDQLYLNGLRVLPGQPLPPAPRYTMQVRPSYAIELSSNGGKRTFKSAAPTLGQALWEAGIQIHPGDALSLPASTSLAGPLQVTYLAAVPLTINLQGGEIRTYTSAMTVGQALSGSGISLQGLDYSVPAEGKPVPPGGKVRVVRVREEVHLKQTNLPFETKYTSDPETEIDQRRVIQPGKIGLKISSERVRYENEKEISRQAEAEWTASQPEPQVIGQGTKAVVKKMDTPDGAIEYYRAVTVYATSYSPCRQGMGKCSKSTASGTPLAKGVIAVTLPWYRQFAGQRIYVPGYGIGVVADTGGGIPGTAWIDLGYGEEDFVNWHQNVTIYFLTPVPANVPWKMP